MIQWYPGHMAKALREIEEKLRLVDVVMIILDARIPNSSLNPEIIKICQNKRVLLVLNKYDKADPKEVELWVKHYENISKSVISINAKVREDIKKLQNKVKSLMAEKREKDLQKGLKNRPIRTMIIGIPNVGKSTIINALVGKKVTLVGDKPGVTKTQQWIRINQDLELLDTPGVLWPKFENQVIASNLAITGAIKDEIIALDDLSYYLLDFLKKFYPTLLEKRYAISIDLTPQEYLDEFARKYNHYRADKTLNLETAALVILNDLRGDRLGRITLDRIENE